MNVIVPGPFHRDQFDGRTSEGREPLAVRQRGAMVFHAARTSGILHEFRHWG